MKACKIQFKSPGKKYYFSCEGFDLKDKDKVVVTTIRGIEMGYVVGEMFDLKASEVSQELKEVIRIATANDISQYEKNKSEEPQIIEYTKKISKKLKLDIKILSSEYTIDRSKLTIYFESEERIDFRELVRILADNYKTRIELRQVGTRDGAKFFGGIGPCGLMICCKEWITEFQNVSVKMAKNQSLSLNPTKISGNCGKLLCCIAYENDLYTKARENAPDVGDMVETEKGPAKVITSDILNKHLKVKYILTDGFGYLNMEDVTFTKSRQDDRKRR